MWGVLPWPRGVELLLRQLEIPEKVKAKRTPYSGTAIDSQETLSFGVLAGVRAMNEVLPLERVAEAYERMLSGKARFRVVLTTGKLVNRLICSWIWPQVSWLFFKARAKRPYLDPYGPSEQRGKTANRPRPGGLR